VNRQVGKLIVAFAVIAGAAAWQSGVLKDWAPGTSLKQIARPSLVSAGDAALTAKLQPFIKCINDVDAALRKSVPEYRQFVWSLTAEPGKRQTDQFGRTITFHSFKIKVYETGNQFSKDCIKALNDGVAMAPADPGLDQSGKAYAETLEMLIPLMNAASTYYSQNDYQDDKMQKGKELDAQLMPLFDRLFAASSQMRDTVSGHNEKLRERELAALEKRDGKTFEWHTLNGMFLARRTVDAIDVLVNTDKLTAEAVQAPEQQLQAAYDEGKAYAAAHPNDKTSLGNKPMWFYLESGFGNYLAAIKELRRDLAAGKPQNDIARDFERLNEQFNSLVRDYNMRAKFSG